MHLRNAFITFEFGNGTASCYLLDNLMTECFDVNILYECSQQHRRYDSSQKYTTPMLIGWVAFALTF